MEGNKFLKRLYNNPEAFSDVTFILRDGSTFYGHKGIIASDCELFRDLFTEFPNQTEFELKELHPKIFLNIMLYCYNPEGRCGYTPKQLGMNRIEFATQSILSFNYVRLQLRVEQISQTLPLYNSAAKEVLAWMEKLFLYHLTSDKQRSYNRVATEILDIFQEHPTYIQEFTPAAMQFFFDLGAREVGVFGQPVIELYNYWQANRTEKLKLPSGLKFTLDRASNERIPGVCSVFLTKFKPNTPLNKYTYFEVLYPDLSREQVTLNLFHTHRHETIFITKEALKLVNQGIRLE